MVLYRKRGYRVSIDEPLAAQYSFRPTLVIRKKGHDSIVIEVRSDVKIEPYFQDFVLKCQTNREPVRILLAVPARGDDAAISYSLATAGHLKELGVGVVLVGGDALTDHKRARVQALRFVMPPGAKLGKYHERYLQAVEKFNDDLPVDCIRDVTELVEECVRDIAMKSVKKAKVNITEAEAETGDLDFVINALSQKNFRGQPQTAIFAPTLSQDLKSFKGARNLSHHPRKAAQRRALQEQMIERMEMATRLIREVGRIARRL